MTETAKKIRVCFIAPKAYPIFNPSVEKVFGGAEVDLYLLATELAKDLRFEMSFVVGDYGQPDGEVREGVRLFKSLKFGQNALTGAMNVWGALKRAGADIYIMKTISPGVPLVEHFCRRYKRHFVYKTASQDESSDSVIRQHPVLGRFFLCALKKARYIIVQNQEDRDSLKQHYGLSSIVIPNGHRIADCPVAEKKTILWVGRSAVVKQPQRFLDLAAEFPQERFVMVCSRATGDNHYEHLKERAKQVSNLAFYEHIGFRDIDHFFAEAKVFVNTSDSEGFPNTFIQACKTATAVLSYTVNPDNFLMQYRCGLCGNGTPESLALNLRILLTDDRYCEYGQNGLRYVRQTHNIETLVGKYKELFTELMKRDTL
jgi:glycosyltransferase involved in cell wall biosynthesis